MIWLGTSRNDALGEVGEQGILCNLTVPLSCWVARIRPSSPKIMNFSFPARLAAERRPG